MAKSDKDDFLEIKKENEKLKKFAEEVVEKYNLLVSTYNDKQSEFEKQEQIIQTKIDEIVKLEKELLEQKSLYTKLERKLVEFQKQADKLIETHTKLEEQNENYQTTIKSLEKYISEIDQNNIPIKNARGAGRKKKYKQEDVELIVTKRNAKIEYEDIKDILNQKSEKEWTIKEIKYVYARYK